jgi:predicted phosphate transport protein (TIGR00153 family)
MLGRWKKSKEVKALVFEHLAQVRRTIDTFLESARCYVAVGDVEEADRLALETHRAEGVADDIRREVEKRLISGALLATSRRQVLEIIERVDTLANAAEGTLDYLLTQRVNIPSAAAARVLEILDATAEVFENVECGIRALFEGDRDATLACTERIDAGEGRIDRMERQATQELFRMELDLAHKRHVHGFIDQLVKISDRAEDLADRIAMITAERAF